MHVIKIKSLFAFFFISLYSNALISIAVFFFLGTRFPNALYLVGALAIKTAAATCCSLMIPHFVRRYGSGFSLQLIQVFTLLAALLGFLGFHYQSYVSLLLTLVATSVPTSILMVMVTGMLRVVAASDIQYRKFSGMKEFFIGMAMFVAIISSSQILHHTNANIILAVVLVAILLCTLMAFQLSSIKMADEKKSSAVKPISIRHLLLERHVQRYTKYIGASMLAVGLTPIIAASAHVSFSLHLDSLMRQTLWVVEPLAITLVGVVYVFLKNWINSLLWKCLLLFNSVVLLLNFIIPSDLMVCLSMFGLNFLIFLSYQKFRDDLLVSGKKDHGEVMSLSSFAYAFRSVMFTISPFFMYFVCVQRSFVLAILLLVFMQFAIFVFLYLIFLLFNTSKLGRTLA